MINLDLFDDAAEEGASTDSSREDPEQLMRRLIELLVRWEHAYYVLDAPEVPDSEFDQVYRALQKLERMSHPASLQGDFFSRLFWGSRLRVC